MRVEISLILVFTCVFGHSAIIFPTFSGPGRETTGSLLRTACTEHSFNCSNGNCINFLYICDDDDDCKDNSDEDPSLCLSPSRTCPNGRFKCKRNGKCINFLHTCDNDDDCKDNSDESPSLCQDPARTCPEGYYKCNSTGRCVAFDEACSSNNVCGSNSAELPGICLDPFYGCGPHKFRCSSGSCIDLSSACDQDPDCPDGLDEDVDICSDSQRSCPWNGFKCSSGQCIRKSFLCDNDVDCPDGADENITLCTNSTVTDTNGKYPSAFIELWHGRENFNNSPELNTSVRFFSTDAIGIKCVFGPIPEGLQPTIIGLRGNDSFFHMDPESFSEERDIIRLFRTVRNQTGIACGFQKPKKSYILGQNTLLFQTVDPPLNITANFENGGSQEVKQRLGCNLIDGAKTAQMRTDVQSLLGGTRKYKFATSISFLRFQQLVGNNYTCKNLQASSLQNFDYEVVFALKEPLISKKGVEGIKRLKFENNLTLHCVFNGDPTPYVFWHLNGKELWNSPGEPERDTDEESKRDQVSILKVSESHLQATGYARYHCRADSYLGKDSLEFLVYNESRFIGAILDRPKEEVVLFEKKKGETMATTPHTLTCIVNYPDPTCFVKWFRDQKEILRQQHGNNKISASTSTLEFVLTLDKAYDKAEGTYMCELHNILGNRGDPVQFRVRFEIPISPEVVEPVVGCKTNQFRCISGPCIESFRVCDQTFDCPDQSDENVPLCAVVGRKQFPADRPPFEKPTSNEQYLGLIISLSVAACIIIPLAIGFYIMWRRRVRDAAFFRNLTQEEIQEFLEGRQAKGDSRNGVETAMSLPYDSKYEIPSADLDCDTKSLLGEGNYGCVYKGNWKGTQVAVKSTKPSADVTAFKALLSEVKTMAYIGEYQTVIKLLGCQTMDIAERSVRVVVELSPFGDLKSYLEKNRNVYLTISTTRATNPGSSYQNASTSTADFLYWSFQIADGMNYLASKKVVHADLAARNILLFQNNLVKISDFGLARQLSNYEKYTKKSQTALPWRWLSLESLRFMEFTSQSDVWSFGVLLWEIFTVGEVPFVSLQWDLEFVQSLVQGFRLAKPELASQEIYERMLDCWDPDPQQRITFAKLTEYFKELLQVECPELASETVYIDLETLETE